jgi:drug/metabolite transporter (DMT)-like permease
VAILLHYALVRDPRTLLLHSAEVYTLASANALFCTVLPVTFTMAAVARIGSGATAQLSVVGPISLLFLGHWLLGEAITALQIVGTVVVLAGVYVLTRPAANSVPLAPEPEPNEAVVSRNDEAACIEVAVTAAVASSAGTGNDPQR